MGDVNQLETSLNRFLTTQIALPKISYKIVKSGNKDLALEISEMNVRQANNLIFQIDGWHPKVLFKNLSVSVHPEEKDLLRFRADLSFDPNIIMKRQKKAPSGPKTAPSLREPSKPSAGRSNRPEVQITPQPRSRSNPRGQRPPSRPSAQMQNIAPPAPPGAIPEEIPPELLEQIENEY